MRLPLGVGLAATLLVLLIGAGRGVSFPVLLGRSLLTGLFFGCAAWLFSSLLRPPVQEGAACPQDDRGAARPDSQVARELLSRLKEDPALGAALLRKIGWREEEEDQEGAR